MKWISVKDEIPPLCVGVLVTDGKYIASAQRALIGKSHYWTGYGFEGYEWEFDFNPEKITHWMTLPELPNE